ncbi:ABC transporter [Novosphingobium soli]|uniref:ABC transporter n=1 Tax=Novosphingobium soli TaxID=574956 RepID=UPI0036D40AB8
MAPAQSDPSTIFGLRTSLPIAWAESEDIRSLIANKAAPHWAMEALRARGEVVPLDTLAGPGGTLPLPPAAVLVLAQPQPLTPRENLALDTWVRAGGRVLLFADPMLTAPSIFALGDPRRPQDVALLSPILARWGLVLEFDEDQPAGPRPATFEGTAIPVDLAGRFRASGKSGDGPPRCRMLAGGVLAECGVGRGRVLAVADAALLDAATEVADRQARAALLGRLLARVAADGASGIGRDRPGTIGDERGYLISPRESAEKQEFAQ